MNNNVLTRKSKIDLLKAIAGGHVSLQQLQPCSYLIKVGYGKLPATQFFLNNNRVNQDVFTARLKQEEAYGKGKTAFRVTYGNVNNSKPQSHA